MELPKGKGKMYFQLFYMMYENKTDATQIKKDLKDFESKIEKGEIKI